MTEQSASLGPPRGPARADVALATGAGLAASLAAWLLRQPHIAGDGSALIEFAATGVDRYHHVLIVPLLRAPRPLFGSGADGDVAAAHLAVALTAGVAVGALVALLRALGTTRARALFGVALLATTPGFAFYATTVEVHVPHVAAVVATALAAVAGPWRRPVLATALTGAALATAYGTHVSTPVLGPGVVALCALGARRAGWPLGPRGLLLGVGPALLATLVLAMGASASQRTGRFAPFAVEGELAHVATYFAETGGYASTSFLFGALALLPPLAVAGLLLRRLRGAELGALALVVVPSWVFFFVWGVRERGYLLPTAAFLAWPAALLLPARAPRPVGPALAALVLGAQVALVAAERAEWNDGWSNDDRLAVVDAALPDGGTLVLLWRDAPTASLWRPAVAELQVTLPITRAIVEGVEPAAAARSVDGLRLLLADGPVAVDVSYPARRAHHVRGRRLPYFEAFEAALRERYVVVEHERGVWRALELVQPLGDSAR